MASMFEVHEVGVRFMSYEKSWTVYAEIAEQAIEYVQKNVTSKFPMGERYSLAAKPSRWNIISALDYKVPVLEAAPLPVLPRYNRMHLTGTSNHSDRQYRFVNERRQPVNEMLFDTPDAAYVWRIQVSQ